MKAGLEVKDDGSVQLLTAPRLRRDPGCQQKVCAGCHAPVGSPHERHCRYHLEHMWQQKLPPVDLRSICRASDRCLTEVYVSIDRYGPHEHKWLVLGEGHLDRYIPERDEYTLRAYLGRDATDFEHDSAYAAQLALQGVSWKNVMYHCAEFTAFIPPDIEPDDFHVPAPGYNPFKWDETKTCDWCGDGHPIVPEGYYVPPGDPNALKLLRGKRVRIAFSTERL